MNPTPLQSQAEEKQTSTNSLNTQRSAPPGSEDAEPITMAATLSRSTPTHTQPHAPTTAYPILPPYPDNLTAISPRLQPLLMSGPLTNQPVSPTSSYSSSTSFPRNTALYKRNELPPLARSESAKVPRSHHEVDDHSDSSVRSQGVKRSYDMYAAIRPPPIPTIYPKPARPSTSSQRYSNPPSPIRQSGSVANPTMTTSSSRPSVTSIPPLPPATVAESRFSLHLRQNPRAARAGPDGKDRRTIDPPPVLQLLINDFDPSHEADLASLKAHDWVVHAKLISAETPHEDLTTVSSHTERGHNSKITRLLLGTTVSSPFFCTDDPDSENAPKHPTTLIEAPPSPTNEILKIPNRKRGSANANPDAHKTFPGAFFIFPDLSIRKAGQYRLEFRLMKMTPDILIPGRIVPTISIVVSDVFNVVNAKDFDQVQPSTDLVKGLLDRGAGFPLKLKKGLREGQRKKGRSGDGDGDGDSDDDGDGDEEEGDNREDTLIDVEKEDD